MVTKVHSCGLFESVIGCNRTNKGVGKCCEKKNRNFGWWETRGNLISPKIMQKIDGNDQMLLF